MKRGWIFSIGVILAIFALVHVTTPRYYVSIGAIFRNEARFLEEWIEYHRLIGVEHFYLYNNLSEDDYLAVLEPYVKTGIVELVDWPYASTNQKEWNKIQCRAYSELIQKKKNETFWLALIDTDEFILPRSTKNLPSFLKLYEGVGGVGINWQLYGTSHVEYISKPQTLIGSLVNRAPRDESRNQFYKTIFRPRRVHKIKQPHFCYYKRPFFHVDEYERLIPAKSLTPKVSVDKICINHYIYRDEAFFYTEKARRILDWSPDKKVFMEPNYNEVEDREICSILSELQQVLFKE